eukprot:TRINITY_DN12839_c0_g1_i1.p1 TRINITY_DN12839_c0_g1~~TRINITY_DN12839_c0_g1_i1.p1  ORF type:complete len:307 (-),score=47.61 TRINITY_DN12839_c0_g1_i1:239-1159(-)
MSSLESRFDHNHGWFAADFSEARWSDLWTIHDFKWEMGRTPFSQPQVPLIIGVLYLLSLYVLQNYMKDKKEMTLRIPSMIHNAFLSLLSLCMFLGAAYGAYIKYGSQGFWAGLVCEQDPDPIKGPLFYWSYIFYLSKFYELLDSFLLVLKKKPLLFLHVFHHTVMPAVCWAGLEGKWTMALWTSCFWNSFVHVIMYYYYFISTFGYNPWWKRYLTIIQIYQFVSGVVYTYFYFLYYLKDITFLDDGDRVSLSFTRGCTGDPWAIIFMFGVNNSFLFLFTKWYVDNYSQSSQRSHNKKSGVSNSKSE